MSERKQLKYGAILSYGMVLFNIICGLLYTPWMIRQIGKSDYGLYILVTTFLHYFVVDFGIWMAVNKILSRLRAEGREDEEKNVIGLTTKLYLCLDVVVCIAVVIAYFFIDRLFDNLTPEEMFRFKIAYILAASFSVLSFPFGFVKGVFQSHEYFIQTKLFDFAVKIGIILLTILLLLLNQGLYALVIAYGLVPFIINVSRVIFLRGKGVKVNIRYSSKSLLKDIFSTSMWLFVIVLAEMVINNISPSLLAVFSNTTEIAIFGIGLTLYQYLHTFSSAINGLFLPKVTKLQVNKDNEGLHRLTYRIGRLQLIITGFVALGILLTGSDFIEAWLGPDFSKSYLVAASLVVPQLLINMQQIETTQLFTDGKIKYKTWAMALTAISTILLSVAFIPKLGALGSGLAITISNFLFMVVLMNFYYYRYLGFSPIRYLGELSSLITGFTVVAVICVFIYYFINPLLESGWISFIIKGFVYAVLYGVMLLFTMNDFEKDLLLKPVINHLKSK